MKLLRTAFLVVCALAGAAHAQGYPAKLVRIVVPVPAGSAADVLPRIVAKKLSSKWVQSVIVENRFGAGGNFPEGPIKEGGRRK